MTSQEWTDSLLTANGGRFYAGRADIYQKSKLEDLPHGLLTSRPT